MEKSSSSSCSVWYNYLGGLVDLFSCSVSAQLQRVMICLYAGRADAQVCSKILSCTWVKSLGKNNSALQLIAKIYINVMKCSFAFVVCVDTMNVVDIMSNVMWSKADMYKHHLLKLAWP